MTEPGRGGEAGGLTAAEWQAVLGAVREGVVVHRADGRIVSVNEAACRILALTRDQLLGLDPLDPRWQAIRVDGTPLAGEDHPAMVTLRTGVAVTDEVMGISLPDDTRRWLRVSARLLATDAHDRRVVATFVDVTDEREREFGYRALSESTTDLVALVADSTIRYASPAAVRAVGEIEDTRARDVATRIVHPDDLGAFETAMDQLRDGRSSSESIDVRLRDLEGTWRWFDTRMWQADAVPGRVIVARDITARKSMERELADAEELFRQAFEEAPIGMAMAGIDEMATIARCNWRWAATVGLPADQIVGGSALEFTHPDDRAASLAARERLVRGATSHERMHVRIVRADGSATWHMLTRTLLRDQAGAPRYVLAQLEDVSATRNIMSELSAMAHTDPLTGLANRRGLENELAAVLADPYGMAHTSVFFLDLDGFKDVNDRLGHGAGDEMLRAVADRLTKLTRSHDLLARVGGDEFVVIARHVGSEQTEQLLADRLRGTLVTVPGPPAIEVRASIGVARPRVGDGAAAVIDRADRDMYRNKRRAGL